MTSSQHQVGSDGRALVAYEAPMPGRVVERPLTDFLTQLIACQRQLPSYRRARRAEPSCAVAAYADRSAEGLSNLDRRV